MRILVLTKRQYTNKDLIYDLFVRVYEHPQELVKRGLMVTGFCLSYCPRNNGHILRPELDDTLVFDYNHI